MTEEDRIIEQSEEEKEHHDMPPRFSIKLKGNSENLQHPSYRHSKNSMLIRFVLLLQTISIIVSLALISHNVKIRSDIKKANVAYISKIDSISSDTEALKDEIEKYKEIIEKHQDQSNKSLASVLKIEGQAENYRKEISKLQLEIAIYKEEFKENALAVLKHSETVEKFNADKVIWEKRISAAMQAAMDKIVLYAVEEMEKSGY